MKKTITTPLEPFLTFSQFLLRDKNGGISYLLNREEVKQHLFFSHGRIAIFEGLKILGGRGAINYLVPAYICQSAVEPFQKLGIEVRFYEVDDNLRPETAAIKAKIDQKTIGIMIVNYFGFPQYLEEVKSICKESGLFLIEDNAHGFMSQKGGQLLGTMGDIGVSSIWKHLLIPNGAVLYINNNNLAENAKNIIALQSRQNRYPPQENKNHSVFIIGSLLK